MKKAFKELSNKGYIDEARLLHYVKHWSLGSEEGEFERLLKKLDYDGDGRISYADFQNTIGKDTHPKEFFYFRQDYQKKARPVTCKLDDCFKPPCGNFEYCSFHIRAF